MYDLAYVLRLKMETIKVFVCYRTSATANKVKVTSGGSVTLNWHSSTLSNAATVGSLHSWYDENVAGNQNYNIQVMTKQCTYVYILFSPLNEL